MAKCRKVNPETGEISIDKKGAGKCLDELFKCVQLKSDPFDIIPDPHDDGPDFGG